VTAPLVSFSGLASGFDYRSLVDAIITQERQSAVRLETQRTAAQNQQTAITAFRSRLDTLRTAAVALRNGTPFDATSSTTTVVTGAKALATVVTSPDASPASYSLKVSQLARTEKLAGTGNASATDALGIAGTITLNGTAIDIAATESLSDIRDRINALDTGSNPIGLRATILSVTSTDHRLVLTSGASGAAGITMADTAGTVLQGMGFIDGAGTVLSSAILVDGADAVFSIDGIAMTRTSNVVADAIEGVTLTLVAQEVGAETAINVGRFADSARTAMETFVESYNALVDFVKQQGTATETSRPALYNDSLIRGLRRDLPTQLLTEVLGAAPDLATAASVGLSLTRDGKLSFESATFDAAFATRYDDVRSLFTESTTASSPDVTFVTSGATVSGGTWDVEITAVATKASLATTGFSGLYDAGASDDEMTITDTRTGNTATVAMTTGMTTSQMVDAIQAAITANGLSVDVSAVGNEIQFGHQASGLASGIALTFTGLGDGSSEAWSGPVAASGTDVTGTIGGLAATGSGDLLVGDAGGATAGLTLRYAGSVTGNAGTISLKVGTGAAVERLLDRYLETGGNLDIRESQLVLRTERYNERILDIDNRLELRRASLLSRFLQMETVIARLQQASSSFLSSLAPKSGDN
jgi:flagellar hook-associated protein 2